MIVKPRTIKAWIGILFVLAAYGILVRTTLVINASWSAPHWGYARVPIALWPADIKRGDWIQFRPMSAKPLPVRPMPIEPMPIRPMPVRPPVDAPWPYVKQVRGIAGDTITATPAREIFVGGNFVGHAKTHSLSGRPVDAISAGTIPAGHYFVAAPHIDSHDSRYAEIGLVPATQIMARVWPLPDLPWLGLEGPIITPETFSQTVSKTPSKTPPKTVGEPADEQ